ncbi:prolipoprotein diacylglyceryl transferase [Rickettsiales bacterium LUAb2]
MLLPVFNPIAVSFGPISIHWYALAYIFGTIFGLSYSYYMEKDLALFSNKSIKKKFYEDIIFYVVLGIILGGRFGYVIFYNLSYYLDDPKKIFYLWEGGMSFHGAVLGCIISLYIYCRKKQVDVLHVSDLSVIAAPIGLFLGRIANFINQELIGRPTNSTFGVIYNGDNIPRYPSELFEAFLEGILLFVILLVLWKVFKLYKQKGYITAFAIILYAIFRIIAEFFREPDAQVGFIFNYITMGQILSSIMLLLGIIMLIWVRSVNKQTTKLN